MIAKVNNMCHTIKKLSNIHFNDLINRVEYFEGNVDCSELYLAFIKTYTHIERNLKGGLKITYKPNEKQLLYLDSNSYYEMLNKFLSKKHNVLLVIENPETNEVDIIQ
jgi:hypothetical protein